MSERIRIERMGNGPEAVAHLANGKTLFVAGGAPGDLCTVEITQDKDRFAFARIEELIEPGEARVRAQCRFAEVCGGCPWAQLSYPAQLEAKRASIVSEFARTGGLGQERAEELVADVIPSKREWGYRNKLELAARIDDAGLLDIGFSAAGSHTLVAPKKCPLAVKPLEGAVHAVRGALRFAQGKDDLGIFRVGIRASIRTRQLEVALWTTPGAFPRAHVAKTLESAVRASSIVRVLATPGKERKIKGVEVLSGKGQWEEHLLVDIAGNGPDSREEIRYLTSAPSFFQVNTAQAEHLVETALDMLGGTDALDGAYVADLYSGGGTFSIPLALAGADVVAVESAGSSVRDLRRNAEINGVFVDVVGGDAARELKELDDLDALIVDPPRAGLGPEVPRDIAATHAERVVYVSCNPSTLARDIARFAECGYTPERVQPVDLFPQTHHVETVALLSR